MIDGAAEDLLLEPVRQELKELAAKKAALKAQLASWRKMQEEAAAQEACIAQLHKRKDVLQRELAEPKSRKAANEAAACKANDADSKDCK